MIPHKQWQYHNEEPAFKQAVFFSLPQSCKEWTLHMTRTMLVCVIVHYIPTSCWPSPPSMRTRGTCIKSSRQWIWPFTYCMPQQGIGCLLFEMSFWCQGCRPIAGCPSMLLYWWGQLGFWQLLEYPQTWMKNLCQLSKVLFAKRIFHLSPKRLGMCFSRLMPPLISIIFQSGQPTC